MTALQISEDGGVQTISAPSLPKINLGESQLREQINEAGERINEQLPKQIATTLVVLFFAYLEVKENVLTSPFTKEKPARKALNLVDE